MEPTRLMVDNQTAISLIVNKQVLARTKSLDIDLLFMRDLNDKDVSVHFVPSERQFADYLTKPVEQKQFQSLMIASGLVDPTMSQSKSPSTGAFIAVALLTMLCVLVSAIQTTI